MAGILASATAFAILSSIVGLLLSFHLEIASGPSIVLCASVIYLLSIVMGARSGLLARWLRRPHFHEPEKVRQ
jgi:zinc/manganese transport system permease protein